MAKAKPRATAGVNFAALAARRPRELKLRLPPDDLAVSEMLEKALQEAHDALAMGRLRHGLTDDPAEKTRLDELEARARDAQEALDAASTVMVLRALPKPELVALRAAHPPTAEQIEAAKKTRPDVELLVNEKTFEAALIAASIVATPPLTVDQVLELEETWSEPDWDALRAGALKVNGESRIQLLGN